MILAVCTRRCKVAIHVMHRVAQEKMSAVESCAGFTRRGKHGGNFLLLKALWAPGWYQATFRFLSPKSRSAFQLRKMPLMRILILISQTNAHIISTYISDRVLYNTICLNLKTDVSFIERAWWSNG